MCLIENNTFLIYLKKLQLLKNYFPKLGQYL